MARVFSPISAKACSKLISCQSEPTRFKGLRRRSGSSCKSCRAVPFGQTCPRDNGLSGSPLIERTLPASTSISTPQLASQMWQVRLWTCGIAVIPELLVERLSLIPGRPKQAELLARFHARLLQARRLQLYFAVQHWRAWQSGFVVQAWGSDGM